MQLVVLQVLASMALDAIGRVVRFAQVLITLLHLDFRCLLQDLNSLQSAQICYNCDHSRNCTLTIKYSILLKRGLLQSL
jgi:hypothetical protein